VGSFPLAFLGRIREVHEPFFLLSAGRRSFALKRILESGLVFLLVVSLKNEKRKRGSL
jgi:hypothetical protein